MSGFREWCERDKVTIFKCENMSEDIT